MSTITARPILAIHGSASSGAQWQTLINEFDGERIVLAPDLPGYGKNAASPDLAAPERFDWLGEVIQSLGGQFELIGHSFGGAIAIRLANQHPGRISNVVLYEPIVPPRKDAGDRSPMQDLNALWSRMECVDAETAMEMFCAFWADEGCWRNMSARNQKRLAADYATIMLDFKQVFGGEVCLDDGAYQGPLTILRGDASPPVACHMTETLATLYPQAEVRTLEGLGHLAPATHAEQVNAVFRQCLKRSDEASEAA